MELKTAGVREFARLIGRSHSWVVAMCQRNVLPKTEDGKIPVNEAMAIVEKLDADKAQEKEERAKAKAEKAQLLSFDEARAKKETYLAEIKEMEAKVMRGEFVAVADVKADARATAERLRSFCLAAPSRFAGLLEHRSQRDVEAVLEQMFNELLEKIHGGQFSADEEVKDGDLE